MRALTRMRTLAAACALLLVIAGTAAAWDPTRPIDRTDSPPPEPTATGEPDMGHGLVSPTWQQILLAIRWSNPWLSRFFAPRHDPLTGASHLKQMRGRR